MFGLTKETRQQAKNKIESQKRFLDNHYVSVGSDNISLSTFVKNAYHNADRYIAEVNHRVWSLHNYANNKGLKNIFGTITLPSEYHPKIKNKYKNPKFIDDEHHTPKAGSRQLSKMFKALLDTRLYKSIDKEDKCYFRVYEPHQDGTPHLHFSMFVPENMVNDLSQKFKNYFKKKFDKLQVKFETDINNPVAYLMKYILKTFDDLREENSKVTDLSLWYIHNSITRFYTSRTLMSLDVYRCVNGRYDLLELTHMYKNRELHILLNPETNKVVSIFDNIGNIYQKKEVSLHKSASNNTIKLKYRKKKTYDKPIIVDGIEHIMVDGKLEEFDPIIPVSKMTSLSLYSHFLELDNDIENCNLQHYGLVKNELINRDMLDDEIIPLNLYTDTDLFFEIDFVENSFCSLSGIYHD